MSIGDPLGARRHGGPQYSPFDVLARADDDTPATIVLSELARLLAQASGAREVSIWRADGDRLVLDVRWPGPIAEPVPADAVAVVQDDRTLVGEIRLAAGELTGPADELQRLLDQTADCVLLLHRRDQLRRQLHEQIRHTHRLSGELTDSGRRLGLVRDLERRRMATEILSIGTERLALLRTRVADLDTELADGGRPDATAAGYLRDLLTPLIDEFRVMVRGIHPQVLHTRGAQAALAEVIAGLDGPARLIGSVPTRIDRELAAALYRITAAALHVLAHAVDDNVVDVRLGQAHGRLEVSVTGGARISPAALRAALTLDLDRVTALGGQVEIGRGTAGGVTLRMSLPDRLEPDPTPTGELNATLFSRVRSVTLGIASQYPDGPGASRAQHLVRRLDAPVRLGAHEECWLLDPESFVLLDRRLPDLDLVPWPGPSTCPTDVVLRPSPDHRHGPRFDLVLTGSAVLARSIAGADLPARLTTEVVARTDVLRARTMLSALSSLLRDVPLTGPPARWFAYELEELRTGAYELDELEALAWLRTDAGSLPTEQVAFAERLLGSAGAAPGERLGLPASAGPAELQRTARGQLDQWLRASGSAAPGRHQRQAFRVIAQSCERVLAEVLSPIIHPVP
jgi:signal transduction histidine kinase